MDAEARARRQVVDAVHAGEEAVLLARRVAQPGEHREDLLGVDDQAGLAVLVVGGENRVRMGVAKLARDQLESDRVRHQWFPRRPGRPSAPSGPVLSAAGDRLARTA